MKALSLALALSMLATGCADLAPQPGEIAHATAARTCYERIALAGRFSVQYRKAGKEESAHGGFRWQQDGDNTRVELLSPLGQTLATIAVTPDSATLTPAGQAPRTAPDADALAVMSLGWPLPVAGLRDWLQGCARDVRGKRQAVANDSLTAPDGWRIAYPVWEDAGGVRRPKRIDLRHDGSRTTTEISLRLVIDEWQPTR